MIFFGERSLRKATLETPVVRVIGHGLALALIVIVAVLIGWVLKIRSLSES